MTLHDQLVNRARRYAYAVFGLALLALLGGWFAPAAVLSRVQWMLACLGILLAVLALMAVRFRCPRCRGSLAPLVAHFGPLRRFGRQVQHCPFCGVSLSGTSSH